MTCKWEGKHKGHNISLISRSNDFIRSRLEGSVRVLRRESESIKATLPKLEERLTKTAERKEGAKEVVKKRFGELKKRLAEREAEILDSIEKASADEDKLTDLISEAQAAMASLPEALTTGNKLLGGWKAGELTLGAVDRAISVVKEAQKLARIGINFN